jgi:cation transport ATPase
MEKRDMQPQLFRDRSEAGRLLAAKLAAYANRPDVLVLALKRGGVPITYEVARVLNPMLAGVAMTCSSVSVIGNARRLRRLSL